jgi:hypothetical protein
LPTEIRATNRWEAGAATSLTAYKEFIGELRREVGLSGFASYQLAEYVAVDATIGVLPRTVTSSPIAGGRMLQGLAGVKLGLRRNHVGVFVKTRAGVKRHLAVLTSFRTEPPFTSTRGGLSVAAVDVGAVIEVYLQRRLLIRLDGGDTMSLAHGVHYDADGRPATLRAPFGDAIEVAVGAGWRF